MDDLTGPNGSARSANGVPSWQKYARRRSRRSRVTLRVQRKGGEVEPIELIGEMWRIVDEKGRRFFVICGDTAHTFNGRGYYLGSSEIPLVLGHAVKRKPVDPPTSSDGPWLEMSTPGGETTSTPAGPERGSAEIDAGSAAGEEEGSIERSP